MTGSHMMLCHARVMVGHMGVTVGHMFSHTLSHHRAHVTLDHGHACVTLCHANLGCIMLSHSHDRVPVRVLQLL